MAEMFNRDPGPSDRYRVEVNEDGVVLPNGRFYGDGDIVDLTEVEFFEIKPENVGPDKVVSFIEKIPLLAGAFVAPMTFLQGGEPEGEISANSVWFQQGEGITIFIYDGADWQPVGYWFEEVNEIQLGDEWEGTPAEHDTLLSIAEDFIWITIFDGENWQSGPFPSGNAGIPTVGHFYDVPHNNEVILWPYTPGSDSEWGYQTNALAIDENQNNRIHIFNGSEWVTGGETLGTLFDGSVGHDPGFDGDGFGPINRVSFQYTDTHAVFWKKTSEPNDGWEIVASIDLF